MVSLQGKSTSNMPNKGSKSCTSIKLAVIYGLFFLGSMFFIPKLNGQGIDQTVNFINYTISDGLPSAETYCVFQDSKGFIWVGTDNGVVKYDGAKFKVFTTQDGLTDNTIFKINEDSQGRIWFTTYNRRICYYKNGTFHPYKYNHILEKELANVNYGTTITNLRVTPDDSLILEFVWRHNNLIPNFEIDSLGQSNKHPPTVFYNALLPVSIFQDSLQLFEGASALFTDKPIGYSRLIQSIYFGRIRITKLNKLTAISTQTGVYFYSNEEKQVVQHVLPNYYVTSFITDFEGGLWCTTLYNGLIYIPSPYIIQYELESTKGGHIHGIIETKDELIFSFSENQGNYELNKNTKSFTLRTKPISKYSLLESDLKEGIKFENDILLFESLSDINSIARLNESSLMASSPSHGLIKLTTENLNDKNKNNRVRCYKDKFGFEWFFFHGNSRAREYELDNYHIVEKIKEDIPKIFRIYRAGSDLFYLGTLEGLYEYKISTTEITKSNVLETNNHTRIQDILRVSDSTLLFATKGNGIIGLTNGNEFQIKITHGTEINAIYQLIKDPLTNLIYAATNFGIYQIQLEDNQWQHISIVSYYDGLKLPDVRQIKICNNELYFANNIGVGKIKLGSLKAPTIQPYLHIYSLVIDDKSIDLSKSIHVPYDSNSFEISYQAIGFKSRNEFTYYYRIRKNDNWTKTTNATLLFNSLDPGVYEFELYAENVYGTQTAVTRVPITIETPFWMTWWFVTFIFMVVLFGINFLIYRIITFYKNQSASQRKISELQILSLQSKMNPHFIFNSLNSIQNYILTNNKIEANEYLIEFSRLIRTILQTSEKSTILLSKELEILNMYVDLEKKRLRKDFKFIIEIEGEIDMIKCIIPSLLIQPYIENAIWHGQVYDNENGEIRIQISNQNDILKVIITDNGIGIQKASGFKKNQPSKHKSMGTEVTKNRIQLVAELNHQMSEVTTTDAFPEDKNKGFVGTRISFTIPYQLESKS